MSRGCDFVIIQGEEAVTIGDTDPIWETTFRIQGHPRPGQAFLILNLRHLTYADVPVLINEQEIGVIYHHENWQVFQDHWFTQMISIGGGILRSGENTIQVEAARLPPDPTSDNEYDDLNLKDVICFYKY
jgi:hypothetical protein